MPHATLSNRRSPLRGLASKFQVRPMGRRLVAMTVFFLVGTAGAGCSHQSATGASDNGPARTPAAPTPTGTLSGRVLRDGKPVPGTRVIAWRAEKHAVKAGETLTGEDGKFTLAAMPLDVDLSIVITKRLPGHWLIDHKGTVIRLSASRPSLDMGDIAVGAMPPPRNWPGPRTSSRPTKIDSP